MDWVDWWTGWAGWTGTGGLGGLVDRMDWVDVFTAHTVRQSDPCVAHNQETRKPQPPWADAFSPVHSWSTVTNPKLNPEWGMYFFPPDKLTARVLDRIVADHCGLALLVAPCTSTLPIHQIRRIQRSPMYFFAAHKD